MDRQRNRNRDRDGDEEGDRDRDKATRGSRVGGPWSYTSAV